MTSPPLPENRAVYEITWKNIVDRGRPQITIWHMRIACWIPKATNTLSEYVTRIASPLQQWLHERVLMLRYTYIACLVLLCDILANHSDYSVLSGPVFS